jgi:hypothetical protein
VPVFVNRNAKTPLENAKGIDRLVECDFHRRRDGHVRGAIRRGERGDGYRPQVELSTLDRARLAKTRAMVHHSI